MKTKFFFNTIFILCFITGLSAQPVKKWKYAELDRYIKQSKTPLVINFWATFCKPCVEEIPYFQKAISRYKNKNVKLLLVSLDFPEYYPEKIKAYAEKNGFTAEIVWMDEIDPGQFCPKVNAGWSGVLPATLFINNKKNYRNFHSQQLSEEELQKELEVLTR